MDLCFSFTFSSKKNEKFFQHKYILSTPCIINNKFCKLSLFNDFLIFNIQIALAVILKSTKNFNIELPFFTKRKHGLENLIK